MKKFHNKPMDINSFPLGKRSTRGNSSLPNGNTLLTPYEDKIKMSKYKINNLEASRYSQFTANKDSVQTSREAIRMSQS